MNSIYFTGRNAYPNMKLVKSLMNFECQPSGIFEGLSYHIEDEAIYPIIFAATVGLGYRIKKLVSSNFMGIVSSVSVIFNSGATYLCSSNKGDIVKLEEKTFPRRLKGTEKVVRFLNLGLLNILSEVKVVV